MILHITNGFSGSTVYKNLVGELDNLGIPQIVYNPIKETSRIGKNRIDLNTADSEIIYSHILNKTTDRIFYKQKIKKIVKDIEAKIDLSKIKMIHAHTWYSDGGVAYLLSKKYNIPYITAVRNTDLNFHYKYLLHHRKFGKEILKNANKVILIGEYQKIFFDTHIKIDNEMNNKLKVVPNGVNSFWIENSKAFSNKFIDKHKILYVGTFIKRKKLVELQQAIIELSKGNNIKCELHIVGEKGSQAEKILDNIKTYPDLFKYHGRIEQKEELIKIYNDCYLFAMPSRNETFGLVYVEAMLQGLPILYTANEGIDGFYEEKIGEKVSQQADILEIQQALLKMMEDYNNYKIPTQKLIENHNWRNIALTYKKIYQ